MKIVIYAPRQGHQLRHADLFAAGLKRHGIAAARQPSHCAIDCDLAVFWGHRQTGVMARQHATGGRYLVMERGYLGDRLAWTSLGYDGLNGRADFCLPDAVDPERFRRHHAPAMRDWALPGDGRYALLLGQVPTDAALRGVDFLDWCRRAAAEIQAETGLDVVFRPHPLARHALPVAGTRILAGARSDGTLAAALEGAALAVTWNSNSGVDAVLAGVPTVTMDRGAMAWPVAAHAIGPAALMQRPDRTDWAARLAWCQWTADEIGNGDAWDRLKIGMERHAPEAHRSAVG